MLTAPRATLSPTHIQEQRDDFLSTNHWIKVLKLILLWQISPKPTGGCHMLVGRCLRERTTLACVPYLPGSREHRIEVTTFEFATPGFCDFMGPFISGIINIYKKNGELCQKYLLLSHLVISATVIPRKWLKSIHLPPSWEVGRGIQTTSKGEEMGWRPRVVLCSHLPSLWKVLRWGRCWGLLPLCFLGLERQSRWRM